MKLKKHFFIFLLITSCSIWTYDITLIFKDSWKKKVIADYTETDKKLLKSYEYQPDFPDPFFCEQFMTRKRMLYDKVIDKTSARKSPVMLPKCRIGGIVYTPSNPMVIFISGGKSLLVKKGDVVDSITIVSITPNTIELSYQGEKFTLTQ